jgi:deoxyxylulose-5-phosphate synthase
VREALGERAPGMRIVTLGLPDHFVEHGDADAQWREAGIDAASIAARALLALEERAGPPRRSWNPRETLPAAAGRTA